jgi:hypothetical protein
MHVFLTSVSVGGEWSASSPDRFPPGEIFPGTAPGTQWVEGSVGPRIGLGDMEKRTFLTLPGLELRPLCHRARS